MDASLHDRLHRTLVTLDTFIDHSLELHPKGPALSGFHYNHDLLQAAMANTYLETVGSLADSLHRAIKDVPTANVYWEYRRNVEIVSQRFRLNEKDVVLAFDYTEEDFYGDVEGFWIHGWTGENAVTGKFKFLTCALVSGDLPEKVPLLSIPIRLGHNVAKEVLFCLSLLRPLVKSIKLALFDRGFYCKELMLGLTKASVPYLIFVPRNDKVKAELAAMAERDAKCIHYEFEFNKDKTTLRGETTLALLKAVFDPTRSKVFEWAFATNQEVIDLDHIVQTYKGRWRIETGFRVQDEARIKSKSTDMRVRFFYFVYEQVLQFLWAALYKNDMPFKRFLMDMCELSRQRVERQARTVERAKA